MDRFGRSHSITYLQSPDEFVDLWLGREQGDGLLWDIDLDYFTEADKVPDQRYTPLHSDTAIARALDPSQEWLQEVLANLRGITIALEPKYTGGLSNSLQLFQRWEAALFKVPLFDIRHCYQNNSGSRRPWLWRRSGRAKLLSRRRLTCPTST